MTSFLLGFLAAIIAGVLWLRSARRVRFAARVLLSIAEALDGRAPRELSKRAAGPIALDPKPAKAAERSFDETLDAFYAPPKNSALSPLEREVASALRNMGARKADAEAAARQGVSDGAGDGDFESSFRRAVDLLRKAA
jgi:hypothetical protein